MLQKARFSLSSVLNSVPIKTLASVLHQIGQQGMKHPLRYMMGQLGWKSAATMTGSDPDSKSAEIRRELLPHNIGSLGRAYKPAHEMEYYLKSTPPKRLDVRQPTEIVEWR
ncbi:hypothetical protein Ddye_026283 [Dipteronia dyeriana]|uniref:Uncharacterized protein n=1 Tax=Dipteronia dyeriana TaxID=168575 RepID=A0AAD9TME8_9ROSI|nr:hypothetical protein Ddye_026283 [Dipteronia dyeriana]